MRHAHLAALMSAALLAGCGGGDSGSQDPPAEPATARAAQAPALTDTIRIKDFVFDPSPATIRAGQKISVPNDDAAPHTLTEQSAGGKPSFDTGSLRGRQTGSFVAAKPGTYKVFCEIHPFMKGEIEVVAG